MLTAADLDRIPPKELPRAVEIMRQLRGGESLRDFILRVSPHHPPPRHYEPILALLEMARLWPIKLLLSIPPRHGKTTLLQHAIAWWLSHYPQDTCAYASYSDRQAFSKSRITRQIAERANITLAPDAANLAEWRTLDGGGLLSGGAGSGLTGQGVNGLMVVDDPFKNMKAAQSKIIRDDIREWYDSVVDTRDEGMSVVVTHCVAQGEPVLMADGTWRAVEAVNPGDVVIGLQDGAFVPRRVLAQRSSGDDDILEVRTAKKVLRVNGRHPFLAAGSNWIRAADLRGGDKAAVTTAAIGEMAFETIESVTPGGRSEVFDLTVEGSENFIAGGFVVHNTRWHESDLIGQLRKDPEYRLINLPALAEPDDPLGRPAGEPLWPERGLPPFTKAGLERRRERNPFVFAALFQGRPRPRGGAVFGEPHYYDPKTTDLTGCRFVLAADPAASQRTSADYSAAVVLAVKGRGDKMVAHVVHVYRQQVSVPQFANDLLGLQQKYGRTKVNVEAVGGFKAIPQMLRSMRPDLRINEIIPLGDKLLRAQPAAGAWNATEPRLLVPSDSPPWLESFLAEIALFTGVNDAHDDQVDALAHAWNEAVKSAPLVLGNKW